MINKLEAQDDLDELEERDDWRMISQGYITAGQQQDKIMAQVIKSSLI